MDIFKTWLAETPIAHRGLHNGEFPENSLGAFNNACERGFPIELDVTALDDGTLVVFHDNKLSRLTGRDGYISTSKESDLKDLKLLRTDYTVPTMRETLDLVAGRVPLLIEIKNSNKVGALEKDLLEMLRGYNGEFAVQSFNPYSLEYFKLNAPNILRGQLSSYFKGEKTLSASKKWVLKRMLLNKKVSCPNFISYDRRNLPNRYVDKYESLPVLAWTVTSETAYEAIKKYSDNIIFEGFIPEKPTAGASENAKEEAAAD